MPLLHRVSLSLFLIALLSRLWFVFCTIGSKQHHTSHIANTPGPQRFQFQPCISPSSPSRPRSLLSPLRISAKFPRVPYVLCTKSFPSFDKAYVAHCNHETNNCYFIDSLLCYGGSGLRLQPYRHEVPVHNWPSKHNGLGREVRALPMLCCRYCWYDQANYHSCPLLKI